MLLDQLLSLSVYKNPQHIDPNNDSYTRCHESIRIYDLGSQCGWKNDSSRSRNGWGTSPGHFRLKYVFPSVSTHADGTDIDEGSVFVINYYQGKFLNITATDYTQFLQYNFGADADLVQQHYPLSAFSSSPYPVFSAIAEIETQVNYKCPTYRGLLRANSSNIPVWTYFSSHVPTCHWFSDIPSTPEALLVLGAGHTSEIPLVFANTQNLPLPGGNCSLTTQEQSISAQLVAAWTNFAASANPDSELLKWPQWSPNTGLGINIGNSSTDGTVDYSACQLWNIITSTVLNGSTPASVGNTGSPSVNGSSTGTSSPGSGNPTASATTNDGAILSTHFLMLAFTAIVAACIVQVM